MSSASILAVCRSPDDELFATDGYWTHEKAHLAEGLVIDDVIECLEAHWPLCDRPGQGRAGLRQARDLSVENRGRQGDDPDLTRGNRSSTAFSKLRVTFS